jgi:hypothetical protein
MFRRKTHFNISLACLAISLFWSNPAHSVEFELVEFIGVDLFNMGQQQSEYLVFGKLNINGLLGIRPVFVFSNHISIESSLAIGFPSIFGVFSGGDQDSNGYFAIDYLHHFHYPGLYPYFLVGFGYWWHFLKGDAPIAQGLEPGTSFIARFSPNVGMGITFLSGLKIGVLGSLEGFLGERESFHLILEVDYALF